MWGKGFIHRFVDVWVRRELSRSSLTPWPGTGELYTILYLYSKVLKSGLEGNVGGSYTNTE